MPLEPFAHSEPLTFGVELELQLLNTFDFDLTPMAPDLMRVVEAQPHPGDIKPEITQSMIEISTRVHTRHDELLAELRDVRDYLVRQGERLNFAVSGGGTHPFQHWSERRIYDTERFHYISDLYGYLAKQFTIFGQHVHIGCRGGDEALWLLHALSRYVPHFIALSASSPYSQGVDTGFDSARLNSVFAFPLSGRAPFLLSWERFERDYFDRMTALGVVKSMKDFYWDIRPKPEYGTIELRVCDTPLTVDRAAALAAYLQSLCRWLLHERPFEPDEADYLVYTFNRFQACRFGLDGVLVHPATAEHVAMRDDIVNTLVRIEAHAQDLKATDGCAHVRDQVMRGGNDALWLREAYGREGTLPSLLAAQARRFGKPR